MFNNYLVRTAPPKPGVSISPRINTAQSLGIPTPNELARKRPAGPAAADRAKRGRWDGGATGGGRGGGAGVGYGRGASAGATRGRGASAGAGRGASSGSPRGRGAPRGRGKSMLFLSPTRFEKPEGGYCNGPRPPPSPSPPPRHTFGLISPKI
jgi:hypothetical protein